MPKFITFFSYTGGSAKAMIDRPSDRSAAARSLVESLGGQMESFYWMQGKHDGFLVYSLPDSVSAAGLALTIASTGAIGGIQSHQIFDGDEQAAIVQAAKKATYKPPTG
jgi:uncharacterized protein with GYD domain